MPPRSSARFSKERLAVQRAFARLIRQTYIERRRWLECLSQPEGYVSQYSSNPSLDTSSFVYRGLRFKTVWRALAQYAIDRKLSPVKLVRAQFSVCVRGSHFPYPATFFSHAAMKNYRRQRDSVASLTTRLNSQKDQAACDISLNQYVDGMSPKRATLVVLERRDPQYSPLFLYCLGRSLRSRLADSLVSPLLTAAVFQYLESPREYAVAWKQWIPADIENCVDSIYRVGRPHGKTKP